MPVFYSLFFVFNPNSLVYHKTIKSIQFNPLSWLNWYGKVVIEQKLVA